MGSIAVAVAVAAEAAEAAEAAAAETVPPFCEGRSSSNSFIIQGAPENVASSDSCCFEFNTGC